MFFSAYGFLHIYFAVSIEKNKLLYLYVVCFNFREENLDQFTSFTGINYKTGDIIALEKSFAEFLLTIYEKI